MNSYIGIPYFSLPIYQSSVASGNNKSGNCYLHANIAVTESRNI